MCCDNNCYQASTFGIIKITTFQMIYYCLLFNDYNITLNSFCLFFLLKKKKKTTCYIFILNHILLYFL